MAQRNTPAKTRSQKRLNSFKKKSAEWAKGMRRNRNVSHFLDDIEVTMEKMKALGLRPLLFYGVYNDKMSRYDTKVISPYSMSNETEVMLKKMNMLYNVLLQAWTPEDEGSRRGEKRKGKKGNQRPVSGVERASAPLSGEEEHLSSHHAAAAHSLSYNLSIKNQKKDPAPADSNSLKTHHQLQEMSVNLYKLALWILLTGHTS
ncbi:uncharacterized protein LOC130083615 [Rhinichthys klamathensis goyatoka]|uniref:uncharacterized protein LOC130083615 n=1 Tax=Rhinichthys klamathensis goyatoka TaxID=3034132 RepID=UPI0024B5C8BE|nr:uncharacterized protein LOC130083615 [Rhinichthys klamathensis goyatoka]